ncbi:MAG: endo-polygalacturonase, partial [Streptomyces sp.]|nr:endo-polygalacturonase [Streptomyces sp.]
MNTPLSRRTALQAAGATVLAAGLTDLTASAANADGESDNSAPKLVTYPRPATMPTNTSFKVRVRTAPDGDWQTLDIYRP